MRVGGSIRERTSRLYRAAATLAWRGLLLLSLGTGVPAPISAQNSNLTYAVSELERRLSQDDFEILDARPSRGLKEEVGLSADVRFTDGLEMRVKIRPAAPGGSEFNNEPRYELAAYRLQSLLLDEDHYVVPPTALRMLPRATLTPYAPRVRATFGRVDDVLVVLQYWLKDVEPKRDILDPARLATDATYARFMGNLNVLTYTIKHRDSNFGNFLISIVDQDPRAWSVDNGVAFAAAESDRGSHWDEIRLPRLPQAAIERLRAIDPADLDQELAVLAQWQEENGRYEAQEPSGNLSRHRGVRRAGSLVQLGLTKTEITDTHRRIQHLLRQVDRGKVQTF